MTSRYKQLIPVVFVMFGIGLRYVAIWCIYGINSCFAANFFHKIFGEVIIQLYFFSIIILFPTIVLCFVKRLIFNSWLRFAAWWLPLSIILIAITPETSNSWMPLYFVSKDTVTVLMASIFTIISLILIAWKTFAARKA